VPDGAAGGAAGGLLGLIAVKFRFGVAVIMVKPPAFGECLLRHKSPYGPGVELWNLLVRAALQLQQNRAKARLQHGFAAYSPKDVRATDELVAKIRAVLGAWALTN